jgi:hypothetical protein
VGPSYMRSSSHHSDRRLGDSTGKSKTPRTSRNGRCSSSSDHSQLVMSAITAASTTHTIATAIESTVTRTRVMCVPHSSQPRCAGNTVPRSTAATTSTTQVPLAVRASKKLRSDELLLTGFAATRLRMELDRVPLWRNDHVVIKQLVEDFACYPYLPRLKNSSVLLGAIREGVGLLTWDRESFAYADSYDEAAGRYRGLRGRHNISFVDSASSGLLVRPDVARKQMDTEISVDPDREPPPEWPGGGEGPVPPPGGGTIVPPPSVARPTRFHGTVTVDAARVGRDAGRIAEEVIANVAGLVGARVTKDICSIVLEVPNSALGAGPRVGLWHRTLIEADGGWTQMDRQARVQQENFVCPNELKVDYLAAEPADDSQFLDAFAHSLEHTGGYAPDEARRVAGTMLPEIMPFNYTQPAMYPDNGRSLTDDGPDYFLAVLTNGKVTEDKAGPYTDLLSEFPHVGPPHRTTAD